SRHGRWGTFVDVRRPDLKGRSRNLESQADEQESEAELKQRVWIARGKHGGEERPSRGTRDQRDAIKKKSRGKRSEKEILHGGFAGTTRFAPVAGEDVARDGTHLQADEGGEEFLRGGKNAHPGGGEENQRIKFGGGQMLAL